MRTARKPATRRRHRPSGVPWEGASGVLWERGASEVSWERGASEIRVVLAKVTARGKAAREWVREVRAIGRGKGKPMGKSSEVLRAVEARKGWVSEVLATRKPSRKSALGRRTSRKSTVSKVLPSRKPASRKSSRRRTTGKTTRGRTARETTGRRATWKSTFATRKPAVLRASAVLGRRGKWASGVWSTLATRKIREF